MRMSRSKQSEIMTKNIVLMLVGSAGAMNNRKKTL